MRELVSQEIHKIEGGDIVQNFKESYQNGLTEQEKFITALSASSSLLISGLFPVWWMGPLLGVAGMTGFYCYDRYCEENF